MDAIPLLLYIMLSLIALLVALSPLGCYIMLTRIDKQMTEIHGQWEYLLRILVMQTKPQEDDQPVDLDDLDRHIKRMRKD